jgi:hypothetical protein
MSKRTVLSDVQQSVGDHKADVLSALADFKATLETTVADLVTKLYNSVPAVVEAASKGAVEGLEHE